jgi:hypothetical protein
MKRSRKKSKRAGTTPPLAAARRVSALVVPALWLEGIEQNQITSGSVWYLELI